MQSLIFNVLIPEETVIEKLNAKNEEEITQK